MGVSKTGRYWEARGPRCCAVRGTASDETCTFEGEDKGRLELVEGSGHFIQNERPQRLIEGALQGRARPEPTCQNVNP